MDILSQAKTPDGTITEWANTPVGFSSNLIHSRGGAVVLLAEIMGLSPIEVNEKLKEVGGFDNDQVIYEKVTTAFRDWSAQVIEPYNNQAVLDALANGQSVIVLTDTGHAVRYMGNGICHDPKDGTEKTTLTYPNVTACVIITHIEPIQVIEDEKEEIIGNIYATTNPDIHLNAVKESKSIDQSSNNKKVLKELKKIRSSTFEIKRLLNL